MQVLLVRHAEAIAGSDPDRSLTARGQEQARALGDRMRWYDCRPTHIWSSPLIRAAQTAELVATSMHSKVAIEIVPRLAPGADAHELVVALRMLARGAAVLLVGHEPALSTIGALVLDRPAGAALAGLAPAEAIRIVDGAVRWRFPWDAEAPISRL